MADAATATAGADNTASTADTTQAADKTASTASTASTAAASSTASTAQTSTQATSQASNDQKAYWPADWQKRFAGEDEKELKQVARYQSPEDVWKKARSLEKRLSSGEFRPTKPKDAKPEELAAWRKDMGIPDTHDKYELKFDSGLVIGKEDKAVVDRFLKAAHDRDYTPEQVKGAVEWYFQDRDQQVRELAEKDEGDRVKAIDTVASEWGGKFSSYKNRIENYISFFPESIRESLKSARFPDGTALFNSPDFLKAIVALSLKDIPDGVHVAGGGDVAKTMVDRYQEIQKVMATDRKKYDKDDSMQKEMRGLIEALDKHGLIDKQGNLKKAA